MASEQHDAPHSVFDASTAPSAIFLLCRIAHLGKGGDHRLVLIHLIRDETQSDSFAHHRDIDAGNPIHAPQSCFNLGHAGPTINPGHMPLVMDNTFLMILKDIAKGDVIFFAQRHRAHDPLPVIGKAVVRHHFLERIYHGFPAMRTGTNGRQIRPFRNERRPPPQTIKILFIC